MAWVTSVDVQEQSTLTCHVMLCCNVCDEVCAVCSRVLHHVYKQDSVRANFTI
jgi:hypothetical protein